MKLFTAKMTIVSRERLKNSLYGNPSWRLCLMGEGGFSFIGKTATNSSLGYYVSNYRDGVPVKVTYHTTPKGAYIVDRVEDLD